jgi:hypothetical protein
VLFAVAAPWGLAAPCGASPPAAAHAGAGGEDTTPLSIEVDTPVDGAVIATPADGALFTGRVRGARRSLQMFDIVIAIDRSKSTDAPVGIDLDGDGRIGKTPRSRALIGDTASDDPGDSVLAAQVAAARTLIAQLDPRATRVGVISFSGDTDPRHPDAVTRCELTTTYRHALRALDQIAARWPSGRTNLEAALALGTAELLGTDLAESTPREDARRVLILMTDGRPTLPVPFADELNAQLTLEAATAAAEVGVEVHTFAIGAEANLDVALLEAIAAATHGRFMSVPHPQDLVATFEQIDLRGIERVEVRNQTTDEAAPPSALEPDGRFVAWVPLAAGRNRVEVSAYAADGRRAQQVIDVVRTHAGELPQLEPRLMRHRTRLLESRLDQLRLRQLTLEIERARAERAAAEGATGDTHGAGTHGTSERRSVVMSVEDLRPAAPSDSGEHATHRAVRGGGSAEDAPPAAHASP